LQIRAEKHPSAASFQNKFGAFGNTPGFGSGFGTQNTNPTGFGLAQTTQPTLFGLSGRTQSTPSNIEIFGAGNVGLQSISHAFGSFFGVGSQSTASIGGNLGRPILPAST
ncbi:21555_t:CDS:2, partial [Dentiscutata erythropus]